MRNAYLRPANIDVVYVIFHKQKQNGNQQRRSNVDKSFS